MFFNLYQLDLHNETCVALVKSAIKHQQRLDLQFQFSYGLLKPHVYQFLNSIHELIVILFMFTIECGLISKMRRRGAISFEHVFFNPHRTTHQVEDVQLRKVIK